jgi:iron complex transport system ATP-binding protein
VSFKEIISLKDLRFSYNGAGQTVLQDLSLEIPAAAVTVILGPNGSGKTTLLFILLGLLAPQAGTILIEGRGRGDYSRRALSQLMGLVLQEEHLSFDLSVLEYVLLGRAPYLGLLEMPGEADRRVALEALETTGLTALRDRPLPSLSSGERQLATVARALAQKPRILLLDEPTSHLDLGNRSRVLGVVRALADEGVAVVMTTHDPNAAAAVADYVVLIRQGQTVAAGPVEEVLISRHLSATYGLPVEVTRVRGRPVVLTPWKMKSE